MSKQNRYPRIITPTTFRMITIVAITYGSGEADLSNWQEYRDAALLAAQQLTNQEPIWLCNPHSRTTITSTPCN